MQLIIIYYMFRFCKNQFQVTRFIKKFNKGSIMKKLLFILIIFSLVIFSCGKKDSVTIKNGLVCEIDGKQWVGDTLTTNIIKSAEYTVITSTLANTTSKQLELFSIVLKGELKTGDYSLAGEDNQSYVEFTSTMTRKDNGSDKEFEKFRSSDGKVTVVEFDENHVEGTFNFNLVTTEEPKKTLKVTEGKFNIKITK